MSVRCLSVIVVSPSRIPKPHVASPISCLVHSWFWTNYLVSGRYFKIPTRQRSRKERKGKIISTWKHVSTLPSRDSARIKNVETERNRDSRHNKKPSENNTDWSKYTFSHLSFSTSFTTLSRFTIQDLSMQVFPISWGGRETDGKKLELLRSLSHLETRKKRDGKMGFDEAIYSLGRKRRENKSPSLSLSLSISACFPFTSTLGHSVCVCVVEFSIFISSGPLNAVIFRGSLFEEDNFIHRRY